MFSEWKYCRVTLSVLHQVLQIESRQLIRRNEACSSIDLQRGISSIFQDTWLSAAISVSDPAHRVANTFSGPRRLPFEMLLSQKCWETNVICVLGELLRVAHIDIVPRMNPALISPIWFLSDKKVCDVIIPVIVNNKQMSKQISKRMKRC
jgi:hypothetical protein